jgi:hypothetical protein
MGETRPRVQRAAWSPGADAVHMWVPRVNARISIRDSAHLSAAAQRPARGQSTSGGHRLPRDFERRLSGWVKPHPPVVPPARSKRRCHQVKGLADHHLAPTDRSTEDQGIEQTRVPLSQPSGLAYALVPQKRHAPRHGATTSCSGQNHDRSETGSVSPSAAPTMAQCPSDRYPMILGRSGA